MVDAHPLRLKAELYGKAANAVDENRKKVIAVRPPGPNEDGTDDEGYLMRKVLMDIQGTDDRFTVGQGTLNSEFVLYLMFEPNTEEEG